VQLSNVWATDSLSLCLIGTDCAHLETVGNGPGRASDRLQQRPPLPPGRSLLPEIDQPGVLQGESASREDANRFTGHGVPGARLRGVPGHEDGLLLAAGVDKDLGRFGDVSV
jgi:hypothetical protein